VSIFRARGWALLVVAAALAVALGSRAIGTGSASGKTISLSAARRTAVQFAAALIVNRDRARALSLANEDAKGEVDGALDFLEGKGLRLMGGPYLGCDRAKLEPLNFPTNAYCFRFKLRSPPKPDPTTNGQWESILHGNVFVGVPKAGSRPLVGGVIYLGGALYRRVRS
jgi:hypothetical protein